MIDIEFSVFALVYISCGFLGVLGLWLYYEDREYQIYEFGRAKRAYHCIKCGEIYTASRNVEVCKCPQCEFENTRLKF